MKKVGLVSLVALLVIGLVGCGNESESKKEVHIGYFPNVSHAPAMVGVEEGLITEELEGMTLNTKNFPNGSLFMDALSTGQIDFGYVGPGPAMNRYLQGEEVVVLSGVSKGENVLVVRKDVEFNSLKDLEGKIVATPSTGCTHDLILRKMLMEVGMAVEENGGTVKRIAQKPATMIGLFQQKQIDAALVAEPWASIMEAQGVVNIVKDAEEIPWEGNLPAAVLVAKKEFVSQNPELVQAIMRANQQSIDTINNYKDETAEIISKQIKEITNEEMDKDIIKKSMNRIEYSTDIDKEIFQEFANLSKELGFVEGDSDLNGFIQ